MSGTLDSVQSKMYPWSAKIFATVKQLQRKYTAPKLAILYLIDQEWTLSPITLKGCKGALKREKERLSLVRPSQCQLIRPRILELSWCLLLVFERAPFRIDSREETILELAWLTSVPKYYGQISTYIWQPDAEPPESINARISVKGVDERGCRNVFILLTTSENSHRLLSRYRGQIHNRLSGCSSTFSDAEGEILFTIYNLYMILITDTKAFIEGVVEQLNGFVRGLFRSFISIILNLRMDTEI